jgi:hypothetical protein
VKSTQYQGQHHRPLAASRLTEDILPPDLFAKMKPEFVVPMALFLCSERAL